ncbi:MAG: DUF1844 domain-containing protein [bacterium]|nr:DUF1844 domain-containing protein [bacterium]
MDKDTSYFFTLVYQFSEMAMIGMGKLPGPDGKVGPVQLEAARFAIDVLEMLDRKTKGNRTDDEERFLQQTLTNLRLNFVDEANRVAAAPSPVEETTTQA